MSNLEPTEADLDCLLEDMQAKEGNPRSFWLSVARSAWRLGARPFQQHPTKFIVLSSEEYDATLPPPNTLGWTTDRAQAEDVAAHLNASGITLNAGVLGAARGGTKGWCCVVLTEDPTNVQASVSPRLWVVTQASSLTVPHVFSASVPCTFITIADDRAQAIERVRSMIGDESQSFPATLRESVEVTWDAAPIESGIVRCFTPSAVPVPRRSSREAP